MSLPGSEDTSAATAAASRGAASVKLLQFWRTADAQFAIRGVTDPLDQYYLVLGALSESNVDMVRHIVRKSRTPPRSSGSGRPWYRLTSSRTTRG
jgi:hypothetical protein